MVMKKQMKPKAKPPKKAVPKAGRKVAKFAGGGLIDAVTGKTTRRKVDAADRGAASGKSACQGESTPVKDTGQKIDQSPAFET